MDAITNKKIKPVSDSNLEKKIAALEDKIEEQVNKFSDISTIGSVVTSIMDLDRILPVVMESILSIVNAEVGRMVIFDKEGKVVSSISWGISGAITDSIKNSQNINVCDYMFTSRKILKIDDINSMADWKIESDMAHITSLLALPLSAQDQIVGAIIVANKIDGQYFNEEDLFSLEMIARFAAVAIENSNLHKRAVMQQRIEADLEMARLLQKALMPDNFMKFDNFKICAYNNMAMQVGGDYYDIVKLTPNKFFLVVADVSNKGFPASLLMSSTRSLIRAYAREKYSLAEVMANVNEQLCLDSVSMQGMFVTLIMACLDFENGTIKSVNAGHPPGWVSYPDGSIEQLKSGGPFIGQFPGVEYKEQTLPISAGTKVFLYTDGAFECMDKSGKMLGIDGLFEFFKATHRDSLDDFVTELSALLSKYSADPDWIDDTTYLLAEIT